jgi:hypothetical protein
LHLNRCLPACLPHLITDKLPQDQQRFFKLFHKQKKFSETAFTKLPLNPHPQKLSKDFTNYFSVLYLYILFRDVAAYFFIPCLSWKQRVVY